MSYYILKRGRSLDPEGIRTFECQRDMGPAARPEYNGLPDENRDNPEVGRGSS